MRSEVNEYFELGMWMKSTIEMIAIHYSLITKEIWQQQSKQFQRFMEQKQSVLEKWQKRVSVILNHVPRSLSR